MQEQSCRCIDWTAHAVDHGSASHVGLGSIVWWVAWLINHRNDPTSVLLHQLFTLLLFFSAANSLHSVYRSEIGLVNDNDRKRIEHTIELMMMTTTTTTTMMMIDLQLGLFLKKDCLRYSQQVILFHSVFLGRNIHTRRFLFYCTIKFDLDIFWHTRSIIPTRQYDK